MILTVVSVEIFLVANFGDKFKSKIRCLSHFVFRPAEHCQLFNSQYQHGYSHYYFLYLSYATSKENLFKHQDNSSLIIPFTLMT